jgi:prepilin-type N-terminal cleavage/methylation domain-containing protein
MNRLMKDSGQRGFTFIEILAVLLIVGILTAFIINRVMDTSGTDRIAQESAVKNHIRYAQAAAMKQGTVWGIKSDSTDYWMFITNDPDTAANQRTLPGEENLKVTLAGKKITMNAYTLFFDAHGRPYTSYTDALTNTPVSAANPLSITIDSVPATGAVTFGITPETGFMQ